MSTSSRIARLLTAVVAAGERSAATLPAGTPVTARLLSPVTVTIER